MGIGARSISRVAFLLGVGAASAALAGPETTGQWLGPVQWPNVSAHLIHLRPDPGAEHGRFLMWNGHNASSVSIDTWLWSPTDTCFKDLPGPDVDGCMTYVPNARTNLFCAGHSALADGRLLTAGGHVEDTGNDVGLPDTDLYVPAPGAGTWLGEVDGIPDMALPRWYPTVTTLADGRAIVISGSDARCNGGTKHGEQCDNGCPNGACLAASVCDSGLNQGDPCTEDADCPANGVDIGYCVGICDGGDRDGEQCNCPGGGECESVVIDVPEVLDPRAVTWQWTPLAGAALPITYYPFMFVLPDGKLFMAGAEVRAANGLNPRESYTLDVAAEAWASVDTSVARGGSAAMYEPGRILKSGGAAGDDPSSVLTEIIDMTPGGDQVWHHVVDMHHGRVRHNLTLLADGTVLVTGGTTVATGANNDADGVLVAELYHPDTPAWTELASMQHPRMYHSTALLLPDGRVISAGGGQGGNAETNYPSAEIFEPPYLFRGPRPTIVSAPELVVYGIPFDVGTPEAPDIAKAALVRLGAVTHSFDEDARYVPLAIAGLAGETLTLEAPPDGNHAPPGWYMLFVVTRRTCAGGTRDGQVCTEDTEDAGAGCPDAEGDPGSCAWGGVPSIARYVLVGDAVCAPHTQGFWKRQCSGPHPSGEHDKLPGYVGCVSDQAPFLAVADVDSLCDRLHPDPNNDKCEQAEAQFMALKLNVCSGRVCERCCVRSDDPEDRSVAAAVEEIGQLLGNPARTFEECVTAQAKADAINTAQALCVPTPEGSGCAADPEGAPENMASPASKDAKVAVKPDEAPTPAGGRGGGCSVGGSGWAWPAAWLAVLRWRRGARGRRRGT